MGAMKRNNDLSVMLLAATLLLFCVTYMTECDSDGHRRETMAAATPSASTHVKSSEEETERLRKAEHKPKSIREFAVEEGKEESEKRKNVSRALQTIGANPTLRRTYGFPP